LKPIKKHERAVETAQGGMGFLAKNQIGVYQQPAGGMEK